MPLVKQVLPVLLGPLDTKTDPKTAPAGTLTTAENLLMTSPGRYDKRPGFASAGLSPLGAPATVLGTLDGELIAVANGKINLAQQAPAPAWHDSGACPVAEVNGKTVYASQGDQTCADVCASDGLLVFVYENNNETGAAAGLRYTVVDRATGSHVVSHALLPGTSSCTRPKVVCYGNWIYIFACSTTSIKVMRFAMTAPTVVSALTNAFSVATLNDWPFEISVHGSIAFIAVAGKANDFGVGRYDLANDAQVNGGAFTTLGFVPAPTPSAVMKANVCELAHDYSDGNIWWAFSYLNTSNGHYVLIVSQDIATAALTQLASVGQSATVGSYSFNTNDLPQQMCGYVEPGTADKVVYIETSVSRGIAKFSVAANQIQTTPWTVGSGAGIMSRAFLANGYAYWRMTYDYTDTVQPTAFLMRSDGAIVARSYPGSAGGISARQGCVSSASPVGGGTFALATMKRTAVIANGSTFTGPRSLAYVEYTPGKVSGVPVVAGGSVFVPGGVVQQFDTARATEIGFHLFPEKPSSIVDSGVSGNLGPGVYWYQFVWEWYDCTGRRHQSAPSIPMASPTIAANRSIIVTLPAWLSLPWTTKPSGSVHLVGYRTTVDAPQNATYYRTNILVSSPITQITWTDNLTDALLKDREPLYIEDGSILENLAPPPSNVLHVWGNRLWAVNSEDPAELWPSKDIRESLGIAFSDALKIRADDPDGGFRALSDLEDKLVAFKARAIYYLAGEGPDDAGNGAWGQIQRLPGSVGCSSARSVLKVPGGIMFQATDRLGIYRLGGDGGLAYAGAPIEALNGETIVGAAYVTGRRLACWVTSTGKVLVYDTVGDRWYVWPTGIACVAVALYEGELALFDAAGTVYVQTPATWADNGSPVLSAAETSWISAAGIGGLERFYTVQVVGTYYSPHTLTAILSFDFGTNQVSRSIAMNTTVLPDGSYRAEVRVPLAYQKATAMKVRIVDSFPLGATQGAGLTAISVLVGMKSGRARLPAARALT